MTSDSRSLAPASCRTPMKRSLLARCYASIDMKTYELLGEDATQPYVHLHARPVGPSELKTDPDPLARDPHEDGPA